jgi:hypothetical protein
MQSIARGLLTFALGMSAFISVVCAQTPSKGSHVVFLMTNDANDNQVVAYESNPSGSFVEAGRFDTGGRGTGGGVLPLESQG